MADDTRSIFITGLRNAHAMENQALSIMKPQISRIENYPMVAARLEEHYRETENQIGRLERILADLDESPSTIKDWTLSAGGSMAAMGHSMAGDEILKNSFANFAFEHYEIAAYKSLLAIADLGGFSYSTDPLTQTLREEEAMAGWIGDNLKAVTLEFVSLSEKGETAKV
jgi:ferritin-like metal-binding protein YciE